MHSTDRYTVIGNPIAHSKSPEIHAYFAAQTQQNMTYERQLAPLGGFAATVAELIARGDKGANVTVPFKLEAHALAIMLTERARAAGAVNTLTFECDVIVGDKIIGDNTDGVGLVNDIVVGAGVSVAGKRILMLGAGGAARGVMLPLLLESPAQITIANRTTAKAAELAMQFASHGAVVASEFDALEGQFDIIINATSASLSGDVPPIPSASFGKNTFAYDMMYGAEPTAFLRFAAQHGAVVRDGLGMLIEQAAEAFFLWRGVRPNTATLLADLRKKLV